MNVLSLFDGMSCGQQALERAGIKVDKYFASEIDKYAMQVTMANYPGTIQLGSVVNVNGKELPKIDILIGGSPCQSFSFAGKRKGMSTKDEQEILTLEHYLELKAEGFEFEGQSYLFWEYMRLLDEVKPKYFLLENVMMGEKWEKILSKAIGVKPIMINSSLISAQNRQRLYWTNIGLEPQGLFGDLESIIELPKDKGILLKDILENKVEQKYFLSDKMINGFLSHNKRHIEEKNQTGFNWKPTEGNKKAACLRANAALFPTDNTIITHNLQRRSADRPSLKENKNAGGSGHLSKSDGKTYCLDIGNTQAIEIVDGDFRYDEGFRWRDGGKTGTLCTNAESYAKIDSKIRRLTPVECERLQTVKDNYTNHVSDSQRYKMLGNGWTVDVIVHILNYIK
ncbi:Dcm Site-specific DNA methylase [uncultured Caudovirales phage]|uniref:DNA (cytosine-5-)-methyltransferase n=1 Tax=uncultured Caudovirales phage TaxID=2100421 RepID=A0A6J5LSV9_9CAUD|nr:Dcm Site-specific DNA methylase [uncultured Caudovirales phage]